MAVKIKINTPAENEQELADILFDISEDIKEGYTSGEFPEWSVVEVQDEED